MTVVYNRVALIGLGLIASSMFWSIRRGNLANEVVGYAKSKKRGRPQRGLAFVIMFLIILKKR